jgi:hypothetical protein
VSADVAETALSSIGVALPIEILFQTEVDVSEPYNRTTTVAN